MCTSNSRTDRPTFSTAVVCIILAIVVSSGCKLAADGKNLQGVRLVQQGQYDAAMQEFQKAVATDPSNANAYYNMGATLHRVGIGRNDSALLTQAETLYNQCLDRHADHTDCYRGLAVLLTETGRSDRAFNLLKNWVARSPQVADARIELARLYEEFGDGERAKQELTEALHLDQQNARAWNALGRLREQAGDYVQALANYQRSFELNRFQPDVGERIAALNRTVSGGVQPARPGDTRTVNSAIPVIR